MINFERSKEQNQRFVPTAMDNCGNGFTRKGKMIHDRISYQRTINLQQV